MSLFPELNKTKIAIERLQAFEPKEGYYLAFSGGKDSQCIYHLAKMAGVKFDAHYSVTTVDPPELISFIKKNYPDVHFEIPETNMWNLIEKEGVPPTRLMRYCCKHLKESHGNGRFMVTGIRAKESVKRSQNRKLMDSCTKRRLKTLNPIIDWTEDDVWMFIRENKIAYCKLYDEGFDRLGCIGCPMAGDKRWMEFRKYPTIMKKYIKAFNKMLVVRKEKEMETKWQTGQEVFDWWMQ